MVGEAAGADVVGTIVVGAGAAVVGSDVAGAIVGDLAAWHSHIASLVPSNTWLHPRRGASKLHALLSVSSQASRHPSPCCAQNDVQDLPLLRTCTSALQSPQV